TVKLRNDILMFQQHQSESLSEAWTHFKDLLKKVPHHGIDLWIQVQILYDHVNRVTRRTINQSAGGKLYDKNAKESWVLLEDLALYDNESWNDPRDFAKPVKAISLPQDVLSTSDHRLIELENQVQCLMDNYLAPKQTNQVNKIASSCEIYSGPHDTQYYMENPEQDFVEYASSRTDKAGGKWLTKYEADLRQQQSEMINKVDAGLKAMTDLMTGTLPSDTVKNPKLNVSPAQDESDHDEQEERNGPKKLNVSSPPPLDASVEFVTEKVRKLNSFLEAFVLVPRSSNIEIVCIKNDDGDVMFIEIIKKNGDSKGEELEEERNEMTGEMEVDYFDTTPTRDELAYHKYLISGPIPSLFLRNPIIIGGCPTNLKIPCNIGHVHVEKAYIDLNSPLNFMTRMLYKCIKRIKLVPRETRNGGVSNFTGRVKGMHIFVGNFTYVSDFMIVEDISLIIDPRLSHVVLGRPFVEISGMTHDLSKGLVRFTDGNDEITYKMPYKIEQYSSLSDLEKEHTKSIYFRNEEDKRR
ncbi:MAK10-like protein, partial [Tanacetum coccineum]